ncbi:MAG: HesA/MoeB/ThiF family protein [Elusimicrobiota bacterium]|nr:HesA/MoeB/ThiF family protein [Elusimicrobiota bacterium]
MSDKLLLQNDHTFFLNGKKRGTLTKCGSGKEKPKREKYKLMRYNRQLLIHGWGKEKQEKLKNSTVFIAGAGGLGSPVAIYLACAGIGRLRICDSDTIEMTNLNRQILHNDSMIGRNKALSAKKTLQEINPEIEVIALTEQITKETISELVADSEIIVDCLDNFPMRFILNKYAVENRIPFVFAAIYSLEGQISFIHPPETFCLACLYKEAPPNETFPVVGVTSGVIGCLEALEVLKYLVGIGENLKNKLLLWDGLNQEFCKLSIKKDPECSVCS